MDEEQRKRKIKELISEDRHPPPKSTKFPLIVLTIVTVIIGIVLFLLLTGQKPEPDVNVADLRIDGISNNKIYLQNTGNTVIPSNEIFFLADDQKISIIKGPKNIQPGETVEFTIGLPSGVFELKLQSGSDNIDSITLATTTTTTLATATTTLVTTTTLANTTNATTTTSSSTTSTTIYALFACPDSDIACMNEKFSNCERAGVTLLILGNYYYEIIGLNQSLCKVYVRQDGSVLTPEWNGKEMNCNFDNSQTNFSGVTTNQTDCNGPLSDAINVKAPTSTIDIELTISTSKDTYNVGESVSGAYIMNLTNYTGEIFKSIISYKVSREGFEKRNSAKSLGYLRKGDIPSSMKSTLKAFSLNATGYLGAQESFSETGIYTYYISIYDCAFLETTLSKDCDDIDHDEITDSIQTLAIKSKNVTVV